MAGREAPRHNDPEDLPVEVLFAALADPVRLTIVRQLAQSEDWARACGSFDVPVGKAGLSHHFTVLREAGLVEQRNAGARRENRLRRDEVRRSFPGLLELVLRTSGPGSGGRTAAGGPSAAGGQDSGASDSSSSPSGSSSGPPLASR
jgi:DNA-binding transcriptional ArsR family regulator